MNKFVLFRTVRNYIDSIATASTLQVLNGMWKEYLDRSHRFVHGLVILFSNFLRWFHEKLCNYNVFIPEEDDYEDGNGESSDPVITVKRQRYATRLYILLLIGE